MKKFIVSFLLVLSVASWANATTTFKLWLDADPVTSGDYNVRIYVQLVGLNPKAGETLADMAINIWSPDSVGVTQPKLDPDNYNLVTTDWNPKFTYPNWVMINAASHEYDGDGDMDAYQMAFGTLKFRKPGFDFTTNPILVATQTWTMLQTPTAPFSLEVGADVHSRFWTTDRTRSTGNALLQQDGILPAVDDSFEAVFDNYQFTGATLGPVPEPLTMVAVMMGLAGLGRYVRNRVRH